MFKRIKQGMEGSPNYPSSSSGSDKPALLISEVKKHTEAGVEKGACQEPF
jgi:hypothetical protein